MTEGNHYPSASPAAQPPEKLSLWQRFKRWPLIARIGTIGCGGLIALFVGLVVLGVIFQIADPDGAERRGEERQEREAEEEDEREAEEEAAQQAAEEEEEADDQKEVPDVIGQPGDEARDALEETGFETDFQAEDGTVWNPANWVVDTTEPAAGEMADEGSEVVANVVRPEEDEDEPEEDDEEEDATEIPEGIDAQIALLTDVRDFNDAEVYFAEGDESFPYSTVHVSVEVPVGWSESTMCRSAREQTIRGLQFMRDRVTDEYDRVHFGYHARSEQDATGDSSILPMAAVTYTHATVQAIDDSAVTINNVWLAADEGGEALVCQRAN